LIALQKGPIPEILEQHGARWKQEYLDARDGKTELTDTIRFRYRHPKIKDAIRNEAHSKCIYCESIVAVGETDHIRPVSKCPEQIVDWNNLGLVCKECNTHKSDYDEPLEPLLNPFVDQPEAHLYFIGNILWNRHGSDVGERTILRIKLNRPALLQKRNKRLLNLLPLVTQWQRETKPATRQLLRDALLDEATDQQEFAAMIRELLRSYGEMISVPC
jgi:hypothetical protein